MNLLLGYGEDCRASTDTDRWVGGFTEASVTEGECWTDFVGQPNMTAEERQ